MLSSGDLEKLLKHSTEATHRLPGWHDILCTNWCFLQSFQFSNLLFFYMLSGGVKYLGYAGFCLVCLNETPILWNIILLFHAFTNVVNVLFWFSIKVQRDWRALLYY